jgi:hypothetical protein
LPSASGSSGFSRVIIEEPGFSEQAEKLRLSYPRLDEAMRGAQLVLVDAPEIFPIVPGTELRRLRLHLYAPGVVLDVWFTFDAETVRLLHIEPMI